MKPFDLEEYIKNPNRKVVTREGRPVRIVCTDFGNEFYPIIGELQDEKEPYPRTFTDKGKYLKGISKDDDLDLFFVPEIHEGWINVYSSSYFSTSARIFSSEEEAKKEGKKWKDYVATVKIEWET